MSRQFTAKEIRAMFKEWEKKGGGQTFQRYWNLNAREMADITIQLQEMGYSA